ncbi:MAG: TetR family transcriptional regulator [Clostridiales bacterium]|jgi:probable dihydroxyacetone kinase regulator|nr:TetR family transcriptional regulator [Clostridiales bacterium]
MSQTTKKALAASLKKLLAEKSFDKITVVDIVNDCEVNRQTFYYHFQDINDLLGWLIMNEASMALDGKKTYDTWQQGFVQILQYARENRTVVMNISKAIDRQQGEKYLYDIAYDLLIGVVDEKAAGIPVKEEDKKTIADFYKYAFVGLALDWINNGMKEDPQILIEHLSTLIQGNFSEALEKYRTDKMVINRS